MNTQQCSKCDKVLPLNDSFFHRNQKNGDGTKQYWRPDCKACVSRITRERRQSRTMAGDPTTPPLGTPCRSCGRTTQKLVFDHCHQTLRFRGWICGSCNKGYGLLGDTEEALLQRLAYIRGEGSGCETGLPGPR